MSRETNAEPCWVVRDGEGMPWDKDHDVHSETREDAESDVSEIKEYTWEGASLATLHAVALPGPCYSVRCDKCGEKVEDDEWGDRIHFNAQFPFDPGYFGWRTVDGMDVCEDCWVESCPESVLSEATE